MLQFNTARVGLNTANPFLPHHDHRLLSRGRKNFSYRGQLVNQLRRYPPPPTPKSTLTLTSLLGQNFDLGEW